MIDYFEKGRRLHEAIRAAGHQLREENGVWISSNDAAVQAIIDTFDPRVVIRAEKRAAIKEEAQRRIYKVLPAHKQTNLMAQGIENILAFGPDSTTWPNAQKQIKAAGDIAWSRIKALRAASDAIEEKVEALTDRDALEAHDAATDVDWPE